METIRDILAERLPRDIRDTFLARCGYLDSQLSYFREKEDQRLLVAGRGGWTMRRLRVVLALNAFYQIVLAPLASSARPTENSFVSRIDVVYGASFVSDAQWRADINRAYDAFTTLVAQFGIRDRFLTPQRVEDILYRINRTLDDYDR